MVFVISFFVILRENSNYLICKFCCSVELNNNVKLFGCLYEFCEVCFKKFLVENFVICFYCGK